MSSSMARDRIPRWVWTKWNPSWTRILHSQQIITRNSKQNQLDTWQGAVNVCASAIFEHIWSSCDLDFWSFNLILPKIAASPVTHSILFKLSSFNVLWYKNGPKSEFLTIFGLTVTLSFDLWPQNLVSSSVLKCIKVLNLLKCPKQFIQDAQLLPR